MLSCSTNHALLLLCLPGLWRPMLWSSAIVWCTTVTWPQSVRGC